MNSQAKPSGRQQALSRLTDRLEVLLRKEPNPERTMEYLAERLAESGLAPELRTDEGPMVFCLDLNSVLEVLDLGMFHYPTQPLRRYETAEELVLEILPTYPEW